MANLLRVGNVLRKGKALTPAWGHYKYKEKAPLRGLNPYFFFAGFLISAFFSVGFSLAFTAASRSLERIEDAFFI